MHTGKARLWSGSKKVCIVPGLLELAALACFVEELCFGREELGNGIFS